MNHHGSSSVRAALVAVAILAAATCVPSPAAASVHFFSPGPPTVSRYMVVASSAAEAQAASAEAAALGGHVDRSFAHALHGFSADLTAHAAAALAKQPGVTSVEPNHRFHTTTTQNNPTWGLDRIDQTNLPLDQSYSYGEQGSGVTAYVVDTGIDAAHSEFAGRINTGFNAIDESTNTDDNCIGHGTHVSGTIGGTTWGVAKLVTFTPVLVFDCVHDTTAETLVTALDWVVTDHQSGVPAVLNMSLGGPLDSALNAATTRVVDDGVFVAVAAGNFGDDACLGSPASALGVVTVGAVDRTDTRPAFSDTGACVDVFAPGVEVTSASNTGGFATYSGTSMAAPHVTGVAARFLSAHPTAAPGAVASALLGSATNGVVQDPGTGSANLLLFADPTDSVPVPATDSTPPATPSDVSAEAWNERTVRVAWDAATDDVAVAGYQIFRDGAPDPVGTTRTTEFVDNSADLAPDTAYSYTVKTVDRAGNTSPASGAAVATTSSYSPLAPIVVDKLVSPFAPLAVAFLLEDVNEPGIAESVDVYRDGNLLDTIGTDEVAPGLFEFDDFDVTPGTTYDYTFRTNDVWAESGAFSAATTVTLDPDFFPPTRPQVHATALSASRIRLNWSPSFDDVGVAGYTVYRGSTLIGTLFAGATSFVDKNRRANTEYQYAVRAFDATGNVSSAGRASARTFPALDGYWLVGRAGTVTAFHAGNYGSDVDVLGGTAPPAVAMTSSPDGRGYWVVDASGRVFAHGSARFFASAPLARGDRAVAIDATPSGRGYFVATSRGHVFAYGDATQYGPATPHFRNPIVGIASSASGRGYWLVATDGGVFAFGDAQFRGSAGHAHLRRPVVGIGATPSGHGYWLVASDGGVFAFGDAHFYGSTGNLPLRRPIVGMAVAVGGHGYLLAGADGGIFAFGNARFRGGLGGTHLRAPIVGIAGR